MIEVDTFTLNSHYTLEKQHLQDLRSFILICVFQEIGFASCWEAMVGTFIIFTIVSTKHLLMFSSL